MPEHIVSVDVSDENIMLDGCFPNAIIVPRLAELNNIDRSTLKATEYCDITDAFEKICSFDNMCQFTKTEIRDESKECTDQVAGSFAYDCASGKCLLYVFMNFGILT